MVSMGYDQKHFCHGRGRGFEPLRPRHKTQETKSLWRQTEVTPDDEGARHPDFRTLKLKFSFRPTLSPTSATLARLELP
jgi:hypothetical protein